MTSIYMESLVEVCDASHKTYSTPRKGAVLLKEDGDGCWTIDSYIGPEYVQAHNLQPISKAKARQLVEERGGFLME